MMHGPANIKYRVLYEHVSRGVIYVWFGDSLKDFQGRMTWLLGADVVAYSEERPRIRKTTENLTQHRQYIPIMFNLLNTSQECYSSSYILRSRNVC